MSEPRKYTLTVLGLALAFDPAIPYLGTWGGKRQLNEQSNYDTSTARVGRFTPEKLGSTKGLARIVRVYSNGPVVPGDEVSVLSSADALKGGVPTNILRQPPVPLGTSLETAATIIAGPTDDIGIRFAGDGDAATAHLFVQDISADMWAAIQAAVLAAIAQGQAAAGVFAARVVAADHVLVPWTGTLFVQATAAVAGDTVTLPALTDVPVGAKLLLFRGPSGRWFELLPAGADTINGATRSIRFTHESQGVIVEAGPSGWVATGDTEEATATVVTGSGNLAVPVRLVTEIEWDLSSDGQLVLPTIASTAVDQEFIVTLRTRTGGTGGYIEPVPGERLDNVVNGHVALVAPGDTVRIRRVAGGQWSTVTNDGELDRDVILAVVNPNLALNAGWRKLRAYRANYAAAGDFTLPTAPLPGTRILVAQGNANTVTLQAGANTIVANGAAGASLALAINVPVTLQFFTGGLWIRVG